MGYISLVILEYYWYFWGILDIPGILHGVNDSAFPGVVRELVKELTDKKSGIALIRGQQ